MPKGDRVESLKGTQQNLMQIKNTTGKQKPDPQEALVSNAKQMANQMLLAMLDKFKQETGSGIRLDERTKAQVAYFLSIAEKNAPHLASDIQQLLQML